MERGVSDVSLAFCIQGIKIAGWSYIYSYSFLDTDAPLFVCTPRRPTLSAISDISKITLKTAPENLVIRHLDEQHNIKYISTALLIKYRPSISKCKLLHYIFHFFWSLSSVCLCKTWCQDVMVSWMFFNALLRWYGWLQSGPFQKYPWDIVVSRYDPGP